MQKRKAGILGFLLFFGVAVFLTWPLLPNLFGKLYGEAGDPVNTAWAFGWFRETALSFKAGALHYPYAAYPAGIRAYFPLPLLYMPLALVTYLPRGEAAAYNLIILLGITLNGFFMYLLGERLFKNKYAALSMGLIYVFCPYALSRARYHYNLATIFVFPMVLYALLALRESYDSKHKAVFFVVLMLALNLHPYYSCMVIFMLALLALFFLARKWRQGEIRESLRMVRGCLLLTVAASVLTAGLFYLQLALTNDGLSVISRREGDLYTYAAQAWYYLVPSPHGALLGEAAQRIFSGRVPAVNIEEYVIFLGYSNLFLAVLGTVIWTARRFSRWARRVTTGLREGSAWLIPFAWTLGLASFLFSLPPTVKLGGITLYLPSWFIYRVFPFIRVYARFGVLVFFSVTLVAGACFSFLLAGVERRWRAVGAVLLGLVLAVTLCEFLEVGEKPMQDLYRRVAPYEQVRDLGEGTVIAEYPFVASDESYHSLYLWNQLFHRKVMLNGPALGTEGEAMRLTVADLFDPRTPGRLAYMGADYVVIHKDLYQRGSEYSYTAGGVDLSALPEGLEMVEEGRDYALARVRASRPPAMVIYDPKCSLVYLPGMNPGLWLQFGKQWTMKVDAQKDMTADVEFHIYSVEGDRDLKVDAGEGREITETVGNAIMKITIPGVKLQAGVNLVCLETTAEEVPYNKVFGGHDGKPVSFVMSFWEIREAGNGAPAE